MGEAMTPHATYRAMLARRAELTQDEEARLEKHLVSCGECREVEREYSVQDEIFRSLRYSSGPFSPARPPLSVELRVMAEIQKHQLEPQHGRFLNALLIGLKRNAAALIAVLVLAVLFLLLTPGSPIPHLIQHVVRP
jgi:anti-sigma factor RsiW